MLDSRAAGISSTGEQQLLALQKENPNIQLDILIARSNRIRFSKGIATIKGTIRVSTLLGTITFYIIPTNTLFLFYL